jgi:tetratricopeptide (TPR) repeat protein
MSDDPKEAWKLFQAFEVKHPKAAKQINGLKYELQLANKDPGAAATGKTIVDEMIAKKESLGLNDFAWRMVDPEGEFKNPDLALALRAATEAVRLTEEKDGAVLDTLARVYWTKGDKVKALELQRKAVDVAPKDRKEELMKSLKEYEASQKN